MSAWIVGDQPGMDWNGQAVSCVVVQVKDTWRGVRCRVVWEVDTIDNKGAVLYTTKRAGWRKGDDLWCVSSRREVTDAD